MKKIILAMAFATLMISPVLATVDNSYPDFLRSFFKEFKDAEKVSWTGVAGMTRVQFDLDGKTHFAYYNADNELLVVSTAVRMQELPSRLQKHFSGKFRSFSVKEIYACKEGKSNVYYAVVEKNGKKTVLKSTSRGWNVYSSLK